MALRLQGRYTVTIVTLIVAVVVVLTVVLMTRFRTDQQDLARTSAYLMSQELESQVIRRGESAVRFLADSLTNPMYQYDMEEVGNLLEAVAREPDVLFTHVYDVDGRLMHDGSGTVTDFGDVINAPVTDLPVGTEPLLHHRMSRDVLTVASPIWIGDTPLGGVRIGLSISAIRDDIARIRAAFTKMESKRVRRSMIAVAITTTLLTLIGILLAMAVSRRMIMPIKELASYAKAVGRGNYDAPLLSQKPDELGELAQAFRQMSHDLDRTTVSKRHVDNIIDNMHDTLTVLDEDGNIRTVNRAMCQLTGYRKDELLGHPMRILFAPEQWVDVRSFLERVGEPDAPTHLETTYATKTGEVAISLSASHLIGANGRREGLICMAQDITLVKQAEAERLRLETEMAHAQRLESLGVLAGGIAHDFNNILTAIMGNAALARSAADSGQDMVPQLTRIEESSRRAADLCKQMLAYAGKGQIVVQPINLNELIGEITQLVTVSIPKHVEIHYRLEPSLPAIGADQAQLQQVIMNLVINASEAIEQRVGRIDVTTRSVKVDADYLSELGMDQDLPEGRYVMLEVRDNGCGMTEETLSRIFDPFYTTKFAGRGLGMSAVVGIVRGHNGAMAVASRPGKGTTFRLLFPTVDSEPVQITGKPEPQSHFTGHGVVLVVDDEAPLRELAVAILEPMGFEVLTANDGQHGVEVYRDHRDEVVAVLLDMTMPRMNGADAFKALRRINPEVRVILCSGYNEQDMDPELVSQGLAGFVQKPFSPGRLRGAVKEAIVD